PLSPSPLFPYTTLFRSRESGLTRAEQLPGSAQLQIAARDLEAVRALADHPEALARQRRQRRAVQQHAGARLRPAPDAPAQLMQLDRKSTRLNSSHLGIS